MTGHYPLLVDLHAGVDEQGLCIDLFCNQPQRLEGLPALLERMADSELPTAAVRVVHLLKGKGGTASGLVAETVIPAEIWCNRRFLYLGWRCFCRHVGRVRRRNRILPGGFRAGWCAD
ncbi:hypothetical protein [Candidatus Thiothrix anitrata]|uniref:Uncharacterized protein n=1 Tax=Candidatus Thiothrix anitrata TaxID=2823902 RepID=A0ABX7X1Z7_9GAMM|nr:hypothetical protein [Candidatus Thiothrix anitrata]QTR49292.1 hypothetical protein J8380_13645 [Candidatus Thiothrix anitrata]